MHAEETKPHTGGDSKDASRNRQLDILRGIAILLVLMAHPAINCEHAGKLYQFGLCLERIGVTGVDLFFVLSGFLIGGLLFKEISASGKIDVGRFYIRRAFKIVPGFYLLLICVFFCLMSTGKTPMNAFTEIRPSFVWLQNYLGSVRVQSWSLAVEEHFYLILPMMLVMLASSKRLSLNRFPIIAVLGIVLATFLRVITLHIDKGYTWETFTVTHLRIDEPLFGTLLAYCYHVKPDWWSKLFKVSLIVGLAPALIIAFTPFVPMYSHLKLGIGYFFIYLSYGWLLLCFLVAAENSKLSRFCRSRVGGALAFMGAYSYAIYLWFFDTGALLRQWVFTAPWAVAAPELAFLLSLAVSITVACIAGVGATVLVEKPCLALRDRLFPRRVKADPV